jgi:hypothetical protein
MRFHPHEIRRHLILLDESSAADHVGHSRNQFEVSLHHPVFDAAQLGGIVLVGLQVDAEDFADRAGQRGQLGPNAVRQVQCVQPLQHLLAGEVVVYGVVESDIG